jgi:hypothetical protein
MKRFIAILIILGATAGILGFDGTTLFTSRLAWEVAETCTSSGDEPTALAVGERTHQTILAAIAAGANGDGEIEIYKVPDGANGMIFTAIGITDNGTYTVDIHASTLGGDTNGFYQHIGTLAFIIGLQTSDTATYEMAQSVTVTEIDSSMPWTYSGTADSDRTCEARIDLEGADRLVIVPTTCSADAKLLVKGF